MRVIGPVVVKSGPVITAKQRNAFVAGVLLFWIGSDWPVHDLGGRIFVFNAHASTYDAVIFHAASGSVGNTKMDVRRRVWHR